MGRRKDSGGASKRPASKLKLSRRAGGMTVREAGRLGGLIGGRKGGLAVKAERGVAVYQATGRPGGAVQGERGTPFYEEIGKKGGHRVRTLIEEGKKAASESAKSSEDKTPAPGGEVVPEPAQE